MQVKIANYGRPSRPFMTFDVFLAIHTSRSDFMWMIQKVGLDGTGAISTVQWQRADTSMNSLVGESKIVPVIEVVDAVLVGKVGSILPSAEGGTVQGPYVRTFVGANGTEGIEADPSDGETRSLFDLPRL